MENISNHPPPWQMGDDICHGGGLLKKNPSADLVPNRYQVDG